MSYPYFNTALEDLDSEVHRLIQLEAERQRRRIILIPSESASPVAVLEALGSVFQNIYAEGYPNEDTRWMSEEEILDYRTRLAFYRRYSDPRYYKGVEYADAVEALARRRCAEAFATTDISADDIFVNVQALSGAPANNAVFQALLQPGDTVLSMDLLHGGHLSHGSPANRSGKYFNIVHYTIDPSTGKIDYEAIKQLALEHNPRLIIGGFSSYPWAVDWEAFRAIADLVDAYLLADIAHVAGLVIAGEYPSPLGHAHVITSTTHKSLYGPRGAIIMTTDPELSAAVDMAVFPGEQGGPHVNVYAAMSLIFKFAQTGEFAELQQQVVRNCATLADRLESRGFKIAYGGTNTHLLNLDCKSVIGPDGTRLSGDQAARILDLVGIVVNRNTLPGDENAFDASGIRMGTPWITEIGFKEGQVIEVADIIADVLQSTIPCRFVCRDENDIRGKVDFKVMEEAKLRVIHVLESLGHISQEDRSGYPHFYTMDDPPESDGDRIAYDIVGERVKPFLTYALTSDIEVLEVGENQATRMITPEGEIDGILTCVSTSEYRLTVSREQARLTAAWLRALSDGYIKIDEDVIKKPIGPVWVQESKAAPDSVMEGDPIGHQKPYFIGIDQVRVEPGEALPEFSWKEVESEETKRTALNEAHRKLGAKMVVFAGWDMPVWYSSVLEEHIAVRQAAGLFDVSHMGVFQVEGPDAAMFLNSVCPNDICGNDVYRLRVGTSLYTHFLDPDGKVLDDLIVYRRDVDKFLMVVNASNDEKDWAWLNAVREGKVMVDRARPWTKSFGRGVILRNLRDPGEGEDMRVDIALQGPLSREILLSLDGDETTRGQILKLERTDLCEVVIGGMDLIVSRTGYTGEEMAFELFVHPDQSEALWYALLEVGEPLGLKPVGLGARDSLRTEAGLPLYGQEMGGDLDLSVGEGGFRTYVKGYKPWFIGRDAFLEHDAARRSQVIRFRFDKKGVRMAHLGDPVVDRHWNRIGVVTSCAVDSQGTLTGLACLDHPYTEVGTPIFIFQGAREKTVESPAELKVGDKVRIPTPASVIPPFTS